VEVTAIGWQTAAGNFVPDLVPIALTLIDVTPSFQGQPDAVPLVWLGLMLSLWASPGGLPAPIPVDVAPANWRIAGYLSLWSVYHLFPDDHQKGKGKEWATAISKSLPRSARGWVAQMRLPIFRRRTGGAWVGISGKCHVAVRGQNKQRRLAWCDPFLAGRGWLVLMFGHGGVVIG